MHRFVIWVMKFFFLLRETDKQWFKRARLLAYLSGVSNISETVLRAVDRKYQVLPRHAFQATSRPVKKCSPHPRAFQGTYIDLACIVAIKGQRK